MDSRTLRADVGAFQVQTQDTVLIPDRASRCDGSPHLSASIGDQGRKARCGAITTVRPGDGVHSVNCRLIVEQNPPAPIDLQIDESWS